jgi:hypothetical protein
MNTVTTQKTNSVALSPLLAYTLRSTSTEIHNCMRSSLHSTAIYFHILLEHVATDIVLA